jgi:Domain of unknown function (DUF4307)
MSGYPNFRSESEFLRNRYGIRTSRFGRLGSWVGPAITIALIGGGWLLWSANHYATPDVRSTLVSFQAIDETHISVRYSLIFKNSTRAHECVLVAHDYQTNVVGQLSDQIPAGSVSPTRTVVIPTRLKAVSVSIDHCAVGFSR